MSLSSKESESKSNENKNKKKYFNFENKWQSCWIDSPAYLLAHNKTLHHFVNDSFPQTAKIIKGYESAINTFNDGLNESNLISKLQEGVSSLSIIQDNVFEFLKPVMHCVKGQPDSAFCCLLNLIKEVKDLFRVEYSLIRKCKNCSFSEIQNWKKTIITFSKVKAFNPNSPVSLFKCSNCSALEQEMHIKYKTLPECLIFHFVNGTGESFLEPRFTLDNRQYELSGLIERKKCLIGKEGKIGHHYLTWVLDGASSEWLECDDLNRNILSFGDIPTRFQPDTIHIVMYESGDKDIMKRTLNFSKPSLDLQDNPSLTSGEKKDNTEEDSLLKDSIEGDEITSFAKPILESNVKTSKENSEKDLIETTSNDKNVENVVAAEGDVIKNECFTEGAVGDSAATSHDAEKSVKTSTIAEKTVVSVIKRNRKIKICATCNECTSTGKVAKKYLKAQNSPPKKCKMSQKATKQKLSDDIYAKAGNSDCQISQHELKDPLRAHDLRNECLGSTNVNEP